jgi:hypothetical protein
MKTEPVSSPNKLSDIAQDHLEDNHISPAMREKIEKNFIRQCPQCEHMTIKEMPGGRDAVCKNCGYKDPCCYD